jgi:hypothetical protein
LRHFHYYSIAFVTVAVILVGTAGIEEKPPTDDDVTNTHTQNKTIASSSFLPFLSFFLFLKRETEREECVCGNPPHTVFIVT